MELELRLHPDDAGRLPRLRCIAPAQRGRPRTQHQRLVWHDTPDHALAAGGLALVLERGTWRLERLVPGNAAWPPGAPAPVLERAAELSAFDHALPAPVAPAAGFDGRLTSYALETEDDTVALALLRGNLRSVTEEQPACRVLLAGAEPQLRRLALAIAEELRLEVPTAGLAAEAFALAHRLPAPARRCGAPVLPTGLTVGEAFAWTVGHFADVILHFGAAELHPRAGPEAVHQMRVGLRRLRSCLAVFRPAVQCELVQAADADLKQLASWLGPTRDWDVFVTETAPAILAALPDDARLMGLLRAADRRRQARHAELRAYLGSSSFRKLGIALAWLAGARSWHAALDTQELLGSELQPFASAALHRRLRKLHSAAEAIEEMPPAALHGVRLRAKRMRYGAEIFAPLYPGKAPRRFLRRLSALQQELGALNDGTVASALMAELGGPGGRHGYAVGLVQGWGAARAADARDCALRAWDKFRRQEPFWE